MHSNNEDTKDIKNEDEHIDYSNNIMMQRHNEMLKKIKKMEQESEEFKKKNPNLNYQTIVINRKSKFTFTDK